MSTEERKDENDLSQEQVIESVPNPSTVSTVSSDEALNRLEDHRCAICQNILIDTCRISCGHTYCRHCLNTDRENRCRGTKPTCFICDAAVTEITHNAERDKEIDDLFALLPTTQRLSRARAKAERKTEEENFTKRLKEASNNIQGGGESSSNESIRSGDVRNNCSGDGVTWDNDYMNEFSPSTFYGGTFRIWQGENDVSQRQEDDEGENYREFSHDFTSRIDRERQLPFCRPPVVIHHTVQHVYHTIELQNSSRGNGDNDDSSRESNNGGCFRQGSARQTGWHEFETNTGSDQLHFPSSNYSPPHFYNPQFCPYQSAACGRSAARCYFHNPYYLGYPHQPHPIFPSNVSYPVAGSNHLPVRTVRSSCEFFDHSVPAQRHNDNILHMNTFPHTATYNNEDADLELRSHDEENDDIINNNRCHGHDGLCDFHRTVFRDGHHSNESISSSDFMELERSRSYEMLSPPHSGSSLHFLTEPAEETREDLYESDHEDHHEDQVVRFRISVPIGEMHGEVVERRNSPAAYLGLTSFR